MTKLKKKSIQSRPNGDFFMKKEPPCFSSLLVFLMFFFKCFLFLQISSRQVTVSDTKICRCERRQDIELW